jgi:hypothetical protein
MEWIAWAVMCLLQNASFTMVSRARNSGSIRYHAVAAVGSNGVYILTFVFSGSKVLDAYRAGDWSAFWFATAFYTVFTVLGSIGAHYVLQAKVERGRMRVGA